MKSPGARRPAGPATTDEPRTLGPAPVAAREPLRPQRLLHEAARDAARRTVPTGIGLDSASVRRRMVERLRAEGWCAAPVLAVLGVVERHRFIDSALAAQAYEDTSLPIGHGQTISKPSVVARMLGLLLEGGMARTTGRLGRVLEIGTGCGYQAALLAALGAEVVSIERLRALHERAQINLAHLGRAHVTLIHGDGMAGHAGRAPYGGIVSAAGGERVPAAWTDQLAIGGRLVAPMHKPGGAEQVLVVVDKLGDGSLRHALHDGVRFVPLKSGTM